MKTSEQIRSDFLLNKGSYKRFVSMVMQFPIIELPEYSSQLYARLSEARLVMPAKVSLGTWEPEHNECHSNVSTWCKNMPKYKTVRG